MSSRVFVKVSEDKDVDNYGVYDCFKQNKRDKVKSFGLLNNNYYIFESEIACHRAAGDSMKKEMGNGNFWVVVNKKNESVIQLDIRRIGREEHNPSDFEWKTIRNVLDEAKRFADEGNNIEVTIPAEVSASYEEETTNDVYNSIESMDERRIQRRMIAGI